MAAGAGVLIGLVSSFSFDSPKIKSLQQINVKNCLALPGFAVPAGWGERNSIFQRFGSRMAELSPKTPGADADWNSVRHRKGL
jgi:hypothetical protein